MQTAVPGSSHYMNEISILEIKITFKLIQYWAFISSLSRFCSICTQKRTKPKFSGSWVQRMRNSNIPQSQWRNRQKRKSGMRMWRGRAWDGSRGWGHFRKLGTWLDRKLGTPRRRGKWRAQNLPAQLVLAENWKIHFALSRRSCPSRCNGDALQKHSQTESELHTQWGPGRGSPEQDNTAYPNTQFQFQSQWVPRRCKFQAEWKNRGMCSRTRSCWLGIPLCGVEWCSMVESLYSVRLEVELPLTAFPQHFHRFQLLEAFLIWLKWLQGRLQPWEGNLYVSFRNYLIN